MEYFFLFAGIALALFSLWAIGRKDWVRLTTIGRSADAEVTGHRITRDSDGTSYAAIFRFMAEGKTHEVTDQLLNSRPHPPVGTKVKLDYPVGRPELARVPRPGTWLFVYGVLLFMLGILVARLLDWLPRPGGDMPG